MKREDATFHHCPVPFPTTEWRCKVKRVVDGDTVVVTLDRGFFQDDTIDIRYSDIDTWERYSGTPEERQKGYRAHMDHMVLVEGKWGLLTTTMDRDKYGRILGSLRVYDDATDKLINVAEYLRERGHEKAP